MLARRWRARLGALLSDDRVKSLERILGRYDAAGGALLAGGLAYSALFAIVPMALVTVGLTGLLVGDPGVQATVVNTIANVLPPLRGLMSVVLAEAARSAGTISLVGAVTLIWGGSRFILAFESAVSRAVGGPRTRGVVRRNVLSIGAAVGLVATIILTAIVAGLAAFLDAASLVDGIVVVSTVTQVVLALVPVLLAIGAMALVYRFLPESGASWRAAWLPAVTIGIVLTLFARIFVFLAPRFIGAAATIGALATAFAALAWLGVTFQAILIGAAWVGEREET
jgi:membrane protein